jgi:hypothetical protein
LVEARRNGLAVDELVTMILEVSAESADEISTTNTNVKANEKEGAA